MAKVNKKARILPVPKSKPKAKPAAKSTLVVVKTPTFTVKRVTERVFGKEYHHNVMIINNAELRVHLAQITHMEQFYGEVSEVRTDHLLTMLTELVGAARRSPAYKIHFQPVIEYLEKEFVEVKTRFDNMQKEGLISYDLLFLYFARGQIVYTIADGIPVAGRIASVKYVWGWHSSFQVGVETIATSGDKFITKEQTFHIRPFDDVSAMTSLGVQKMNPEMHARLLKRGQNYCKWALGAHYLTYAGHLLRRSWWSNVTFKAEGRVMIDLASMKRMDNDYFHDRDDGDNQKVIVPTDETLVLCAPWLYGFSFICKRWGEIDVEKCQEIVFSEDAYRLLVMSDRKKKIIEALVTQSQGTFSDLIAGKGGGIIFLLHGNPGVGKTLTAEAIAELLKRPLYMVSVGELGVTATELEARLREILDMASEWNAVVLIDEADIFLVRRTEHDIIRNAMVGVFLRLTEYHQGVLFLTTNRVKHFDPAFHSRISMALKYPDLHEEARREIWTNLLGSAKITGLNVAELGKFDINGRQIKSAIRIAQCLAKYEEREVCFDHIRETIEISQQFKDDLNTATDLSDQTSDRAAAD